MDKLRKKHYVKCWRKKKYKRHQEALAAMHALKDDGNGSRIGLNVYECGDHFHIGHYGFYCSLCEKHYKKRSRGKHMKRHKRFHKRSLHRAVVLNRKITKFVKKHLV